MTDALKFAPNSTIPLNHLAEHLPEVPTDVFGFPLTSHHSFAVSFTIGNPKTGQVESLGMQLVSLDPATYEEMALKLGLPIDSDEYRNACQSMLVKQVMDQHEPELKERGLEIVGGAVLPLSDHVIYPREKPQMSNYAGSGDHTVN